LGEIGRLREVSGERHLLGAQEALIAVVAATWSVRCTRAEIFVDFVLQFVMKKNLRWAGLEKKAGY
jgi:hypothetical protein